MELTGSEEIAAPREAVWAALNDPDVLTDCVPGCKAMRETGPDAYEVEMQLKVAAVGGSFDGTVALTDKRPPASCRIGVSGQGSLGTGEGSAVVTLTETEGGTRLDYEAGGEVGGLVAGVGQRVLRSVSKHLAKQFFASLRKRIAADREAAA
jgi:carbon monoxide dehydrogenase subunit G